MIEDFDFEYIVQPKISGACLVLSADLIKFGVNIPSCLIYNDDHGLSIMSQKLMGKNYKQFIFKNLLKVHARRHPEKRLYVLEENNPNAFGNKKNDKFNRFKNMSDENIRFREAAQVWIEAGDNPETRHRLLNDIADSLVYYGVTMQPNRATYEANRDIIRAHGLPWHEKYTHQALWEMHLPSPHMHASFQYNWSSLDEYRWHYMYDLWGDLIFEFNKRGGRVAYGTDDNYQWSTGGFGNIRELQLVLESGMHPLEVLQSATYNSAQTILEPKLGMIQKGYIADILVVDGSPAENFRYLYPFGAINMDKETEEMYRTQGIIHTIKDGVVYENQNLMREVERIVKESKKNAGSDIVTDPFK